MIYLYDRAICDDLNRSFNGSKDSIQVIDPEGAINVLAQIQNDEISYPAVCLSRTDSQIDDERLNFTRLHKGFETTFDPENNIYYSEKSMPISLTYDLHVYTTNTVDMDEMVRELTFKYSNMYFLTIELPYESKRKIRFGVCMEPGSNIDHASGTFEYLSAGQLYESVIHLKCEGCVLITYSGAKLKRTEHKVEPVVKGD